MAQKQVLHEKASINKVQQVPNPLVTITSFNLLPLIFYFHISQTPGEDQQNGKRIKCHTPT